MASSSQSSSPAKLITDDTIHRRREITVKPNACMRSKSRQATYPATLTKRPTSTREPQQD